MDHIFAYYNFIKSVLSEQTSNYYYNFNIQLYIKNYWLLALHIRTDYISINSARIQLYAIYLLARRLYVLTRSC